MHHKIAAGRCFFALTFSCCFLGCLSASLVAVARVAAAQTLSDSDNRSHPVDRPTSQYQVDALPVPSQRSALYRWSCWMDRTPTRSRVRLVGPHHMTPGDKKMGELPTAQHNYGAPLLVWHALTQPHAPHTNTPWTMQAEGYTSFAWKGAGRDQGHQNRRTDQPASQPARSAIIDRSINHIGG